MSTWLIPRAELTPEQLRAIELSPVEHRVIFGAPGSGKTQILLHRARYLSDAWNVGPDRFHIFVFTNVLRDYIKSALDLLDLPLDCVSTLDSWCSSYYQKNIGRRLPWDMAAKRPDFSAIRQAVLEEVRQNPSKRPVYEFVLVDEGQDLDGNSFDMMRALSKHVTVCMDHKQQIYEAGSDEAEILRRLGMRKRNMTLLEAFRCCPYIVHLAAQFVEDTEDASAYIRQARTEQSEKEKPLLYYASNFDDEKHRLVEILRTRLAKGERVAIMLPQRRMVYGFAQGLEQAGFEVETPDKISFATVTPKLITYHSAKGLTFDSVLIPRLVPRSFGSLSESRIEHLLFVAITRATKWVYMSATIDSPLESLKRLRAAVHQEWLTVQYPFKPLFDSEVATIVEKSEPDADDLLDLL